MLTFECEFFTEASYTSPVRLAPDSSCTVSGRWYSIPGIISTKEVFSLKFVGRVEIDNESLKVNSARLCKMLSGVSFLGVSHRRAQALNVVANIELPPCPAELPSKKKVAFDLVHSCDLDWRKQLWYSGRKAMINSTYVYCSSNYGCFCYQ